MFKNEDTVIEIKLSLENCRLKPQRGVSTYPLLAVRGKVVGVIAHLRGKWAHAVPGEQN